MRVFLVGFMGCGKTSVGRALASRLGVGFADLDAEIEAAAGASVREIFERRGEAEFRRLERDVLASLLVRPGDLVVATGGGTPAQEPCAGLLSAAGLTVWLDAPWRSLVERIGADGGKQRPLFRDEVQAHALYESRLPVYAASDLRFELAAHEGVDEAASRLARRLAERGVGGSGAPR